MMGAGSLAHNRRAFIAENVDADRTHLNVKYYDENLRKVYHELFDEAVERYNAVQNLVNQGIGKDNKPEESKPDILLMVKKTIRGDYGNGSARRKALGKYYDEVQHQINLNYKYGTTNWNNIKLY